MYGPHTIIFYPNKTPCSASICAAIAPSSVMEALLTGLAVAVGLRMVPTGFHNLLGQPPVMLPNHMGLLGQLLLPTGLATAQKVRPPMRSTSSLGRVPPDQSLQRHRNSAAGSSFRP